MLKLTAMSLLGLTMTGLMGMGLAEAPTPPRPGGKVMPWEQIEIERTYGSPIVAAETVGEDRKFQLADGRYFEVGYSTLYKYKRTYLEKTVSGVSMKCTQDSGCFIFINDRGPYVISANPMELLEKSNVQLQLMKPLGKDAGFIQPQGRLLDVGAAQVQVQPAREEIVAVVRNAPQQARLLDPIPTPRASEPPIRGGGVTFSYGAQNTFDQEKYGQWFDGRGNLIQSGPTSDGSSFDNRYYEQQKSGVPINYRPQTSTPMPSNPGVNPAEQTARHYLTDREFASVAQTRIAPDVTSPSPSAWVPKFPASMVADQQRSSPAGGILDSLVSAVFGEPATEPPRARASVSSVLPARSLDTPTSLLFPAIATTRPLPSPALDLAPWRVETPAPANYVAQPSRDARQPAYVALSTGTPAFPASLPLPAPIGAKPSVSLIDRVSDFFAASPSLATPSSTRAGVQVAAEPALRVPQIYGPPRPPQTVEAAAAGEIVELADSGTYYYPPASKAAALEPAVAKTPAVQTSYAPVGRALLNTAWAISAPRAKAPIPQVRPTQFTPQKEFSALPFILGGAAVLVGLVLILNRRS